MKIRHESLSLNKSGRGGKSLSVSLEIRRADYIPNYDTMSVVEQRKILSLLLGTKRIAKLSDKRVSELFRMRIGAAVRELEADLSGVS